MSGSSGKRKNSAGGTTSSKRKKDTDATSPKAGPSCRVAIEKDVFSIIEADGTVEDSKVWGPTMPIDMRRWLPDKMVILIQGSLVSKRQTALKTGIVLYLLLT